MTPIFLRALNPFFLVLFAMLGIACQTTLFVNYPFLYLQPDLILLVTVWMALKREWGEGGTVVLILANLAEINSGAPQGFFLISYMAVFLMIRALSRYLMVSRFVTLIKLTLFMSVFWKLIGLLILYWLGLAENQWRHTVVFLFPGAVMEAISGVWVYRWLEKLDWWTFRDKRAQQESDDLLLDEEGL
jgi:rod shape-determining protein MreD